MGTEEEERHNEVVDEVVKRLAENNLYVNQRDVEVEGKRIRILRVVIRPEIIKINKEKMKEVLD